MENIVITGATGFLGSHMAAWFLNRGDRVWAIVRPESAHLEALPVHENLKIVRVGLDRILDCVEEIGQADAWFHFAWGGVNREEIDSPVVQAKNIEGSLNCVKAAHLLGCKFFADAGSRVEYGVTEQIMTEDMKCKPVNEYGKAKLKFFEKCQRLCQELLIQYCHLRFFSVYGYGDHPWSIISTLTRDLRKGKTVKVSACRHQWNFMYIDDAIEAVGRVYQHMKHRNINIAAVDTTAENTTAVVTTAVDTTAENTAAVNTTAINTIAVNIASEDTRVLKEFVEEVRELAGSGTVEYGAFVQAKEGALSLRPDVSRLLSMTDGWREEYSFRQGIITTIKKEMEQEHEEN